MYCSLESGQHDSTAADRAIDYIIDSVESRLVYKLLYLDDITVVKSEDDRRNSGMSRCTILINYG